uniref:DRBM domain-containing protein n=1 Tax=Kalanchoe fedtschenkoi TaxID=63787 RepID=A0A7N0TPM8_KALFE
MEGVSNCFVFKSRLQEYAQKVGLTTPVYEIVKEGPPHEPSFSATVVVDDKRYCSLPGFTNRKAAEQSAAEIALLELSDSGRMRETIAAPVHEIGLCKNMLQEYALKMNFAIPVYICQRSETPGNAGHFACTVDIGGMKYVGGIARTKKEAEIKAARTALLAIKRLPGDDNETPSRLTVIPKKRKVMEKPLKAKKRHKKMLGKKHKRDKPTAAVGVELNEQSDKLHSSHVKILGPQNEGENDLIPTPGVEGQSDSSRPGSSNINEQITGAIEV